MFEEIRPPVVIAKALGIKRLKNLYNKMQMAVQTNGVMQKATSRNGESSLNGKRANPPFSQLIMYISCATYIKKAGADHLISHERTLWFLCKW